MGVLPVAQALSGEISTLVVLPWSSEVELDVTIFEPGPQGRAVAARLHLGLDECPAQLAHQVLPDKSAGSLASFAEYREHAARGKNGVLTLSALVLDFDGVVPGHLEYLAAHLKSVGRGAWIYTSFSHHNVHKVVGGITGPFDCFRVVLPLSRAAAPAEWELIYPHVVADLLPDWWSEHYPPRGKRGLDPASERYSQGWYLPGAPHELVDQAQNFVIRGADVDVDEYLRRGATAPAPALGGSGNTPIAKVHAALETRGVAVEERTPGQFSACCPAHAETRPSFGFIESDDGSVLVHCFAGCTAPAIADALGLQMRDLFPADDRPEIEESTDECRTTDQACEALTRDTGVFHRLGRLVSIQPPDPSDEHSKPAIRILEPTQVRDRLTRVARFVRVGISKEGEETRTRIHPPPWCIDAAARRGDWPGVRPLVGLLGAPTVRPDGSILTAPGYDDATGLYLCGSVDVSIPDKPTHAHAVACRDILLGLIADFPCVSDLDRSVWLSLVLTRVARRAIKGVTPVFVVDANKAGSGKTKLGGLAGIIASGVVEGVGSLPADDDEIRKALHATALQGSDYVFFDNVARAFGGPALDLAVTAGRVTGRVLGKSEVQDAPLDVTWIVTGNNLSLAGDMQRRVLWCRLETALAHPENRTGFQIEDLEDHVVRHRAFYLSAALTLLSAYHEAGRPKTGRELGSFGAWSRLVAGAVRWVGLPCPLDSQERARELAVDHGAAAEQAIVRVLRDKGPCFASDLMKPESYAMMRDALEAAVEGRGPDGRLTPRQVGKLLAGMRRRVVECEDGLFRVVGRTHQGTHRWQATPV